MIANVKNRAMALTWFGAVPFVSAPVALLSSPHAMEKIDQVIAIQHVYGCSILSFVGAVSWGAALRLPLETEPPAEGSAVQAGNNNNALRPTAMSLMTMSVVPSLVGFACASLDHLHFIDTEMSMATSGLVGGFVGSCNACFCAFDSQL